MKVKHPKFQFLNENGNPTLEQVFNEAQKPKNTSLPKNKFSNGMFFLTNLLHFKKIQIDHIYEQCTAPIGNLYVAFQAIGCFQSGGLAVGLFGNTPHLIPHLFDALENIGHKKEAKAIKSVKNTFPPMTDFCYSELYNDILNFMENPKRKITHPKIQNISMEEKQKHHQSYVKALDEAEPVLEQAWFYNPYIKLVSYYDIHKNKKLFL